MTEFTDPARDIWEICERLSKSTDKMGDDVVAQRIGVDPWSSEFYQIIFTIMQRLDELSGIVNTLEYDGDILEEVQQHIVYIKEGFSKDNLRSPWNRYGYKHFSAEHSGPIKAMSPMVRARVCYPKLTDGERSDLLAKVDELISWLKEHQLRDKDFIRQSIIEGLDVFSFRLARVGWLGWGYSLDSLSDVMLAYLTLERGVNINNNPDAGALLKKVSSVLSQIFEKAKLAKEGSDIIELATKLLTSKVASSAATGIAGYLSGQAG